MISTYGLKTSFLVDASGSSRSTASVYVRGEDHVYIRSFSYTLDPELTAKTIPDTPEESMY